MSVRASRGCETEDGRSCQSDRDTVRYDGVIDVVSGMLVILVQAADGITQTVAQVDTSVAETDTLHSV